MELKRKKKFKKSSLGLFGLIIISIGIIIISYDYVMSKKEEGFITCTKDSDHEQTVYILELTNKEE